MKFSLKKEVLAVADGMLVMEPVGDEKLYLRLVFLGAVWQPA